MSVRMNAAVRMNAEISVNKQSRMLKNKKIPTQCNFFSDNKRPKRRNPSGAHMINDFVCQYTGSSLTASNGLLPEQ